MRSVRNYKKAYPAALAAARETAGDDRIAKDKANAAASVASMVEEGKLARSDVKKMDAPMVAALDALGV